MSYITDPRHIWSTLSLFSIYSSASEEGSTRLLVRVCVRTGTLVWFTGRSNMCMCRDEVCPVYQEIIVVSHCRAAAAPRRRWKEKKQWKEEIIFHLKTWLNAAEWEEIASTSSENSPRGVEGGGGASLPHHCAAPPTPTFKNAVDALDVAPSLNTHVSSVNPEVRDFSINIILLLFLWKLYIYIF